MEDFDDNLLNIVTELVNSYENIINNSTVKWFKDRKIAIKKLKSLKKLDNKQIMDITDNPVDSYCKLTGITTKSYYKERIIKKYLDDCINEVNNCG